MFEDGHNGTRRHGRGHVPGAVEPGFGKPATARSSSSTSTSTSSSSSSVTTKAANNDDTTTTTTNTPPEAGTGPNTGNLEPLACVTCRSRKLRCDRTKPACARCAKLKAPCVYPESRRKPAFKRRNVRELEERLAQVEVLLKDATASGRAGGVNGGDAIATATATAAVDTADPLQSHDMPVDVSNWHFAESGPGAVIDLSEDSRPSTGGNNNITINNNSAATPNGTRIPAQMPFTQPFSTQQDQPMAWGSACNKQNSGASQSQQQTGTGTAGFELLGLGMFEALPPSQMIEELHETFFTIQHPLIPIIHPGRYMTSFYSAPHLRPPMALQYAIWTMATNGHPKYQAYHGAFHSRARHYLHEDEMRGDGEHFLTVAHAQAWAIMATNEARNMWFTRAAMSAARCIKLLHMMGLHRLDDPDSVHEMAPTLAPPRDWTELEERRRTFWGAFAIDSHASISTGWPILIDPDEVTTHLPSTEEAFNSCREEPTCRLQDVFTGSSYSSFAGAAVICHIFNCIMKQVHRNKPNDGPDNYEYGRFWNNHRELDNMLSSIFMFLPEGLRLPAHLKDPVAVHTNLNLHASVICLHNCAYEKAVEHNFPEHIKAMLKTRLTTAADEVVNIVKMTSHSNAGYRSPLVALALYVASSVCILQAQDATDAAAVTSGNPSIAPFFPPKIKADMEFLLTAMEAIGKQHTITLNFLRQLVVDLERTNLVHLVRIPNIIAKTYFANGESGEVCNKAPAPCGNNIPLFARSRASRRADLMSPLPGRLPLNKPIGTVQGGSFSMRPFDMQYNGFRASTTTNNNNDDSSSSSNKRKRVKVSSPNEQGQAPGLGQVPAHSVYGLFTSGQVEEEPSMSSPSSPSAMADNLTNVTDTPTPTTSNATTTHNNNDNSSTPTRDNMPLPPFSYGNCFSRNMNPHGMSNSSTSSTQLRLPHRTTAGAGGGGGASSMSASPSPSATTMMNNNLTPPTTITSSGISPVAMGSLHSHQQRQLDTNVMAMPPIPPANRSRTMPVLLGNAPMNMRDARNMGDMMVGAEFNLNDMNMFPELDGWDGGPVGGGGSSSSHHGTNGNPPSALYAQQVAEAMLNDDSWMMLNAGEGSGVGGPWNEGEQGQEQSQGLRGRKPDQV